MVIIFAVAASVPSPPAFDFVSGHESVEDSLTEEQASMDAVSNNNMPLTAYSFRAKYSEVEEAADRELKSRGFVKEKFGTMVTGRAFYVRGSTVALGLAPAAPGSKP